MTHCNSCYGERTNMLTLSAMIYNTARLSFEAQNAMAFRVLRLVAKAAKSTTPPASALNLLLPPVPFLADTELVDPPASAPTPVAHTQRASERKAIKKTAGDQKRSKKRSTSRR